MAEEEQQDVEQTEPEAAPEALVPLRPEIRAGLGEREVDVEEDCR